MEHWMRYHIVGLRREGPSFPPESDLRCHRPSERADAHTREQNGCIWTKEFLPPENHHLLPVTEDFDRKAGCILSFLTKNPKIIRINYSKKQPEVKLILQKPEERIKVPADPDQGTPDQDAHMHGALRSGLSACA